MKRLIFITWLLCLTSTCFSQQSAKHINGWKVSQSHYDEAYIRSLSDEIGKNTYRQIKSIIVIKNGALLIEAYFNGATRDQPHDVRSVGKTFASAVLGIAIDEGHIKSLDQTIKEFYDLQAYGNFSDKKQKITLRNLVTMSSGFEGNDNDPYSPGNEENMYPEDNWVRWALDLPMAGDRDPGDRWTYFTAGVVVLGDILHQSVPGGLEKYADKKLFKPLGISNYQWKYTPQRVASTAGGIQLTPLDFAKFGQLYLSRGKWDRQQILPEKWVEATMTRHYKTAFDNDGYGYLMWNKRYTIGDRHFDTFYCSGNGGNKIFILKELNAVVVITASAYNQRYAHPQVDEMMTKYILPSLLTVR